MQLIEPVIRGKAKSFVPKADATRAYNEYIQDELTRTVWTGCISWYHAGSSPNYYFPPLHSNSKAGQVTPAKAN